MLLALFLVYALFGHIAAVAVVAGKPSLFNKLVDSAIVCHRPTSYFQSDSMPTRPDPYNVCIIDVFACHWLSKFVFKSVIVRRPSAPHFRIGSCRLRVIWNSACVIRGLSCIWWESCMRQHRGSSWKIGRARHDSV